MPDSRQSAPRRASAASLAEVLGVVALVVVHLWQPWRYWPGVRLPDWFEDYTLIAAAGVIAVLSFVRLRETPAELGLKPPRFWVGWASMGVLTAIGLAGLAALAFALGWYSPATGDRWCWLAGYVPGLLLQQFALQCFLSNRVYYATAGPESRRRAITVVLATTLFVALHAPNFALMALVVPAGLVWTWHFRRYCSLWPLLVSHLLLGATAMLLLGEGPLMRLRDGRPALKMLLGQ